MKQPDRQFKNTHFNLFGSWEAVISVGGRKYVCAGFNTEREAAIKVDLMLIEHNKQPVNILKRK